MLAISVMVPTMPVVMVESPLGTISACNRIRLGPNIPELLFLKFLM